MKILQKIPKIKKFLDLKGEALAPLIVLGANQFCCNCVVELFRGFQKLIFVTSVATLTSTIGKSQSTTRTSSGGMPQSKSLPLSFKDVMRQKEHDRQSRFQPKNKKIKPNSCKEKEKVSEVSINIGYMKSDSDGNLKRYRGKMLPIKVSPTAGRNVILEKAVRKHANHSNNILDKLTHVLLIADGNEIITLPGTEKEFVLSEYKEDIGKNYNCITLFIALKSAHMYAAVSKLKRSFEESETESTNSVEGTSL